MKSDYSVKQPKIEGDWPKGHITSSLSPYTCKPASLTIRKELNQTASAMAPRGFSIYNKSRRN